MSPPRLVHPPSGRVLADRLEVPRTAWGRGKGLMLRRRLEPGEGVWIAPCASIHTCFVRFPIDALFLDRRLRVVRVVSRLGRWRLVLPVPGAYGVVELPAGTVADLGLRRGEPLLIEPAGGVG